jgi:hypothetical protein
MCHSLPSTFICLSAGYTFLPQFWHFVFEPPPSFVLGFFTFFGFGAAASTGGVPLMLGNAARARGFGEECVAQNLIIWPSSASAPRMPSF